MPNRLSRFAAGVMEACWLLALIVTPLFFNIYSSRVFEPDKISILRSLALVALVAWLIKLISEGGPRFEPGRSNFASPANLMRAPLVAPVAALVLVYLIATIFSVSPHASLFGSYQRLQGTFTTFSYLVLLGCVAANLRRRAQADRIITTIVVTSLPIGLYGILQHFRLDPLPWGGDTTARVTGNMGNAIFIAAYLIMAALIALGRVVMAFHAILTEPDGQNMPYNVVRAAIYIFILAVDLVTIWWSGSRGPWLGLLAGLFFFFVLMSLQWRARRLTLTTIGLAALLAVFLVVLNIPNGPLEPLRDLPGVGRLGHVFETEEGTGRVRVLIWTGIVKLMTPHSPIEYPDGGVDRWNAIRPLIGYGPEALYVAYNRFYPPELGQIEARNASPDRSHNETFDALAFTGLLGLAVYLALFTAVFYYGLKWLGLIGTHRRRNIFLALVLGGGVLAAIALVVWQGPQFFGVGLPFGMILGLIVFLTLYALAALPRIQAATVEAGVSASSQETWRAVTLISIVAALVAHFTEIHFGIAIVSTRTHFWLLTGLMLVLGFIGPGLSAQPEPVTEATTAKARRRGRAAAVRVASTNDSGRQVREEWAPILVGGLLTAALLVTLGYDYITNAARLTDPWQIVVDAFSRLPTAPPGTHSYAILGLILLSWVVGGGLVILEEPKPARTQSRFTTVTAGLGLALLIGLIAWLVLGSHLADMARTSPTNLEELKQSASSIAATITIYYLLVGAVGLGLAGALHLEAVVAGGARAGARGRGYANTGPFALIGYVTLPLAAILLSVVLNLQVIQADIVYKTGLQFDDGGQPQAAIPLYERALALSPGEDYYYLFLGRSYLNATNSQTDATQRDALLARAEDQLKAARKLNPLNTDHTANLARLNRRWAELSTEQAVRDQHAQASSGYYAQAVRLSPDNAGLWNEWAALNLQVLGDATSAQQHLDQSWALDTTFVQTYQLQGDVYSWQALHTSEADSQIGLYQKAIGAYLTGLEKASVGQADTSTLRVNLASAYASSGQPQLALEQYQQLLAAGSPNIDQWRVQLAMSQLYAQLGDMAKARNSAEQALAAAPEADKPNVKSWLDRLP